MNEGITFSHNVASLLGRVISVLELSEYSYFITFRIHFLDAYQC